MVQEIIIECSEMETLEEAFSYLARIFGFKEESISKLDTLYDKLLEIKSPVEITFEDVDLLDIYLNDFGEALIETFEAASEENENIRLF